MARAQLCLLKSNAEELGAGNTFPEGVFEKEKRCAGRPAHEAKKSD